MFCVLFLPSTVTLYSWSGLEWLKCRSCSPCSKVTSWLASWQTSPPTTPSSPPDPAHLARQGYWNFHLFFGSGPQFWPHAVPTWENATEFWIQQRARCGKNGKIEWQVCVIHHDHKETGMTQRGIDDLGSCHMRTGNLKYDRNQNLK